MHKCAKRSTEAEFDNGGSCPICLLELASELSPFRSRIVTTVGLSLKQLEAIQLFHRCGEKPRVPSGEPHL